MATKTTIPVNISIPATLKPALDELTQKRGMSDLCQLAVRLSGQIGPERAKQALSLLIANTGS